MEKSKNWENYLQVLAIGTLCSQISFLAQKLRAVAREQTHTQTEKAKLREPFFCTLFFSLFLLGQASSKLVNYGYKFSHVQLG